ncbi:MAG: sigma 54-interacting transcriptional regulator, partial [Clostridia bacterium]|nr:sigma 54-interacting transcriptional regulator [Clostridia bacterium]
MALDVDVEITDRDLIRVAGTGEFSRQLGNSLAGQGRVHAHVLRIGATVVIEDPGHHELCRTCVMAKRCYATAELCCPIKHGNSVAGVMGLVSRTQAQRRRLLDNVRANVAFLERMADLLSAKITSEEAMARDSLRRRQLEAVIGAFDQGVLVVDEYGTMTQANRYALDALHLSPEVIVGKPLQDVLAGTGLYDALGSGTEIKHHRTRLRQHSGDTIDVICNAYPVVMDGQTLGAVLTFQRLDDVSKLTYEIWEHENRATSLDDIIGDSQAMSSVKEFATKIAPGSSTVLLRGESGTGKGLMARAIHRESKRRD